MNRKFQPLPERAIYANSGFKKLCDDTETYTTSLLAVADRVRSATNCPLFRAYLLLRIGEIADLRPTLWGLPWAPAFEVHRSRIKKIVQGDLESGDWMVPEKNERLGAVLDRYFQEIQPVSYLKQAQFFQHLTEATIMAGMAFAGHVAPDTQVPHLLSPDTESDLWGLDATNLASARLYHWSPAGQTYRAVAEAAPFSPLYALKSSGDLLLQAAEQSAYVKAVKPWLNPVFPER